MTKLNNKGFVPPLWFIPLLLLLLVTMVMGATAVIWKVGYFYLAGSALSIIVSFILGRAKKAGVSLKKIKR